MQNNTNQSNSRSFTLYSDTEASDTSTTPQSSGIVMYGDAPQISEPSFKLYDSPIPETEPSAQESTKLVTDEERKQQWMAEQREKDQEGFLDKVPDTVSGAIALVPRFADWLGRVHDENRRDMNYQIGKKLTAKDFQKQRNLAFEHAKKDIKTLVDKGAAGLSNFGMMVDGAMRSAEQMIETGDVLPTWLGGEPRSDKELEMEWEWQEQLRKSAEKTEEGIFFKPDEIWKEKGKFVEFMSDPMNFAAPAKAATIPSKAFRWTVRKGVKVPIKAAELTTSFHQWGGKYVGKAKDYTVDKTKELLSSFAEKRNIPVDAISDQIKEKLNEIGLTGSKAEFLVAKALPVYTAIKSTAGKASIPGAVGAMVGGVPGAVVGGSIGAIMGSPRFNRMLKTIGDKSGMQRVLLRVANDKEASPITRAYARSSAASGNTEYMDRVFTRFATGAESMVLAGAMESLITGADAEEVGAAMAIGGLGGLASGVRDIPGAGKSEAARIKQSVKQRGLDIGNSELGYLNNLEVNRTRKELANDFNELPTAIKTAVSSVNEAGMNLRVVGLDDAGYKEFFGDKFDDVKDVPPVYFDKNSNAIFINKDNKLSEYQLVNELSSSVADRIINEISLFDKSLYVDHRNAFIDKNGVNYSFDDGSKQKINKEAANYIDEYNKTAPETERIKDFNDFITKQLQDHFSLMLQDNPNLISYKNSAASSLLADTIEDTLKTFGAIDKNNMLVKTGSSKSLARHKSIRNLFKNYIKLREMGDEFIPTAELDIPIPLKKGDYIQAVKDVVPENAPFLPNATLNKKTKQLGKGAFKDGTWNDLDTQKAAERILISSKNYDKEFMGVDKKNSGRKMSEEFINLYTSDKPKEAGEDLRKVIDIIQDANENNKVIRMYYRTTSLKEAKGEGLKVKEVLPIQNEYSGPNTRANRARTVKMGAIDMYNLRQNIRLAIRDELTGTQGHTVDSLLEAVKDYAKQRRQNPEYPKNELYNALFGFTKKDAPPWADESLGDWVKLMKGRKGKSRRYGKTANKFNTYTTYDYETIISPMESGEFGPRVDYEGPASTQF